MDLRWVSAAFQNESKSLQAGRDRSRVATSSGSMWAVSQAAAWSFSSLGIAWVIQPSGVVDKALEALDCVLGLQQRCERRIAYRLLDVVDRRADAVEPGRGEVGVDEDRGRRRVVDLAA